LLADGTLRLLVATFLRADGLSAFASRQDLEAREKTEGKTIFMSPKEAAAALRCGDRRVALLTHAWRTVTHPDPGIAH
jgi:hypothetical protein